MAKSVPFDPKKTIYLIDGSSFLYRAYYGTRPLHTAKGVPVQAVYSFCRMLKKLIDGFAIQYCALVWDSKGPTERHTIYKEYKATRQAPPSDLFMQKEYVVQFADLIGLKQVEKSGHEADDLMFSLARDVRDGNTIVLITSDKDMGQMLDATTYIYDAFKNSIIDVMAFEQAKGFSLQKLPFYFSLVGDSSDNIPGVKGIGEKGATELVQKYATLIELYAHLDDIAKKRTQEALITHREDAFLSEQLFLLRYHPTQLSKEDLAFNAVNWRNARPLFIELDFKSLLKDLGATVPVEEKIAKMDAYAFKCVTEKKELEQLCAAMIKAGNFALDTEGTGLDPLQATMVGVSVSLEEGTAYYIPFGHMGTQQLPREYVLSMLQPILENDTYKKTLHNVKFDQLSLLHAGITLRGVSFDSMIAAHLLTQDWQRIGLKSLSEQFFDEPMLTYGDIVTRFKRKDFSYVPLDEATQYSACDAHQTWKLTEIFKKELEKEPTLKKLLYEIELPLIQVLVSMEAYGIYLDVGMLENFGVNVQKDLMQLEEQILSLAGKIQGTFNVNSPKQVEQLLFYELKLPPQKKSAKGSYSTDQEVLEALEHLHPIPSLILKYRELFKLKSTYIDALPMYVNPITQKIHTSFSQTSVATGRLASSDPNLQNIPVTGAGLEIRAAFKPEEGHLFVSADYSQIELRVLAHLSQDQHLIDAFLANRDIHTETAARLFEISFEQVSHEQRQIGKRINFSILYGLTPYGLSKDLHISFADAKKYIDRYFEQYPRVRSWMEEVIEETKQHGYVTTLYGRRRYIPAIYEKNRPLYEEARRVAINTKAQGTAADIMKLGMLAVHNFFVTQNVDAHIVLQIHDELLLSMDESLVATVTPQIVQLLESVVQWRIPLRVSTRAGKTWKDVSK